MRFDQPVEVHELPTLSLTTDVTFDLRIYWFVPQFAICWSLTSMYAPYNNLNISLYFVQMF